MPPVTVSLLTAVVAPVPQEVDVTAQIEGTREVEIRARVTGIILKQSYQEGERVKAGDLLFKIDPATYEIALSLAKAQLAQEQARFEQAEAEANRQAALLAQKAASAKEAADSLALAQAAKAARDVAAAKVRSAELDLSYCDVTSPIEGYAGRQQHSEGSLVSPGVDGLLTTVVQRDQVWVRFGISEQEFKRLFAGESAQAFAAKVEIIMPDNSIYPVEGKVNFVSAQVDARLGTIQMRAEFPNDKNAFLPGQYTRVRLLGQSITGAVTVPASCLMQSPKGRFVYVINAENKAQINPVEVGEILGPKAILSSGLKAGDRVVIDNLQKVRPGAVVVPRGETAPAK